MGFRAIGNRKSEIGNASSAALASGLRHFGAFRKRWAILEGLAWFVLLGPGALLAWFLADWALRLPPLLLLASFLVVPLLAIWAAAWRLVRPLLRRIRPGQEALLIESLHGELDNQIIGSLQLGTEVAEAAERGQPLGYSASLVWALVERTAARLAEIDPTRLLDLRRARRSVQAAAVVAIGILCCLAFAQGAVATRVSRLRDAYAALLDSLFPVTMRVQPGDVAVVRGRPVTLSVEVLGARRRHVRLLRSELPSPPAGHQARERTMEALELKDKRASLTIEEAEESFTYQFEYAGRTTPTHTVLVGDLPAISAINYELAYPSYTGQPPRTLVGRVSRLQALVGTEVLVSFAATTDLHPDYSYVEWQDGSRQAIAITGRFGHFAFTVVRQDRAAIHLTGSYGPGFEMELPVGFEVATQADEAPTVSILLRTRKLTMLAEEAAAFALAWVAEDDFGVAEVNLNYKIDTVDPLLGRPVREGSQSRRFDPPQDRVRGKFTEIFKGLSPPLEPGDRITLTVSARDNNTETGPRAGRSQPVEIVIVRPDLAGFAERRFGFEAQTLLGGLHKIKRATNLLIDPVKGVHKEARQEIARHELKSRIADETWPSGAEDAVSDYFRLLSGVE